MNCVFSSQSNYHIFVLGQKMTLNKGKNLSGDKHILLAEKRAAALRENLKRRKLQGITTTKNKEEHDESSP